MAVSTLKEVVGRESTGNMFEEAARVERSKKSRFYTSTEGTYTVATGQTNRALTTDKAAFFTALGESAVANMLEVYSDQQITLRIRTKGHGAVADTPTANLPGVLVRANTLRVIDFIADITEIYVTNASGSTANIEMVAI